MTDDFRHGWIWKICRTSLHSSRSPSHLYIKQNSSEILVNSRRVVWRLAQHCVLKPESATITSKSSLECARTVLIPSPKSPGYHTWLDTPIHPSIEEHPIPPHLVLCAKISRGSIDGPMFLVLVQERGVYEEYE
ncbi:hypothetical protein RRF57_003008 [Xylaria bambusicola]|uniref:Uncharacterized protein n=1 Tax=Xylaria bambusicola TaxID=326684 RepID=A0AAN7Z4Y2_9PEZI